MSETYETAVNIAAKDMTIALATHKTAVDAIEASHSATDISRDAAGNAIRSALRVHEIALTETLAALGTVQVAADSCNINKVLASYEAAITAIFAARAAARSVLEAQVLFIEPDRKRICQ